MLAHAHSVAEIHVRLTVRLVWGGVAGGQFDSISSEVLLRNPFLSWVCCISSTLEAWEDSFVGR